MTATRSIKPFGLRMNPDVKKLVEERATRNGRSLNSEINQILIKELKEGAAEKAAKEQA
jgi:predicted HicB family RNase H-like nuclease